MNEQWAASMRQLKQEPKNMRYGIFMQQIANVVYKWMNGLAILRNAQHERKTTTYVKYMRVWLENIVPT